MYKQTVIATSLIIGSLLGSQTAAAQGIDIALSDETASFNYVFDSSRIVQGGADASLGVYYTDRRDPKDVDATIGQGKFLVTGNMRNTNKRVKLSAGVKGYLGTVNKIKDTDILAGAVGGKVAYIIPNGSTPMAVFFEGYVAPRITSGLDVDGLTEARVGYEAELAPSAKMYVGYRRVGVTFNEAKKEAEVEDNFHLGVVLSF